MAGCRRPDCDCEATQAVQCGGEMVELCEGCAELVELAARRAVDLLKAQAGEE